MNKAGARAGTTTAKPHAHDSSYDVDGCEIKCKDMADDGNTKQGKLDDCHDCIGDKSCVTDIASCSSTCGSFVP